MAAAPACNLTHLTILIETIGAGDAEQNIFGQLAFGMDHADYVFMRAPKPTLICAATRDFFDINGTRETCNRSRGTVPMFAAVTVFFLVNALSPRKRDSPLRPAWKRQNRA